MSCTIRGSSSRAPNSSLASYIKIRRRFMVKGPKFSSHRLRLIIIHGYFIIFEMIRRKNNSQVLHVRSSAFTHYSISLIYSSFLGPFYFLFIMLRPIPIEIYDTISKAIPPRFRLLAYLAPLRHAYLKIYHVTLNIRGSRPLQLRYIVYPRDFVYMHASLNIVS